MWRLIGLLVLLPLLGACSDVQMLGATAVEQRRVMNDMQARASMAAVCDISLGAYFRELNELERRYAGLVCGDVGVVLAPLPPSAGAEPPLPEQLVASERTGS